MIPRAWVCIACVVVLLSNAESVGATEGCLIDACCSPVITDGGVLLVCPAGDGPTLASIGATVSVTVLLCLECGTPIPWIPAEDFWIVPHNSASLALCNGYRSSDADAASDENGYTTMSGSVAAGGSRSGGNLNVVDATRGRRDRKTIGTESFQMKLYSATDRFFRFVRGSSSCNAPR